MTVIGQPPAGNFAYTAQKNETDLAYLQRLAQQAGAVFSIKGDKLIFHDVKELSTAQPILVIKKEDVSTYSFSDRITLGAVIGTYFDGEPEKIVKSEAETSGKGADNATSRRPVESQAQQANQAKAAAHALKSKELSASLTLEGNINLVAGANIELQGWGIFDKIMQISQTRHKIDSGGYTTEIEIKNK